MILIRWTGPDRNGVGEVITVHRSQMSQSKDNIQYGISLARQNSFVTSARSLCCGAKPWSLEHEAPGR